MVFGSPLSNEPSAKQQISQSTCKCNLQRQDSKDKGKEERCLPSYIRDKRRGSSTKLCKLAFRRSGYEGNLPTKVIMDICYCNENMFAILIY